MGKCCSSEGVAKLRTGGLLTSPSVLPLHITSEQSYRTNDSSNMFSKNNNVNVDTSPHDASLESTTRTAMSQSSKLPGTPYAAGAASVSSTFDPTFADSVKAGRSSLHFDAHDFDDINDPETLPHEVNDSASPGRKRMNNNSNNNNNKDQNNNNQLLVRASDDQNKIAAHKKLKARLAAARALLLMCEFTEPMQRADIALLAGQQTAYIEQQQRVGYLARQVAQAHGRIVECDTAGAARVAAVRQYVQVQRASIADMLRQAVLANDNNSPEFYGWARSNLEGVEEDNERTVVQNDQTHERNCLVLREALSTVVINNFPVERDNLERVSEGNTRNAILRAALEERRLLLALMPLEESMRIKAAAVEEEGRGWQQREQRIPTSTPSCVSGGDGRRPPRCRVLYIGINDKEVDKNSAGAIATTTKDGEKKTPTKSDDDDDLDSIPEDVVVVASSSTGRGGQQRQRQQQQPKPQHDSKKKKKKEPKVEVVEDKSDFPNRGVSDVFCFRNLISATLPGCGFDDDASVVDSRILVNDDGDKLFAPTEKTGLPTEWNMQVMLEWLVLDAQPGDLLLLFYSGHGAVARDDDGTAHHHSLCTVNGHLFSSPASDNNNSNNKSQKRHISAAWIHQNIVAPLPAGVRFLSVMHCCYAGGMAHEIPFVFSAGVGGFVPMERRNQSKKDGDEKAEEGEERRKEPTLVATRYSAATVVSLTASRADEPAICSSNVRDFKHPLGTPPPPAGHNENDDEAHKWRTAGGIFVNALASIIHQQQQQQQGPVDDTTENKESSNNNKNKNNSVVLRLGSVPEKVTKLIRETRPWKEATPEQNIKQEAQLLASHKLNAEELESFCRMQ